MNRILLNSHSILVDIIDNDEAFNLAVNKVFKGKVVDYEAKNAVSALVGCALRHIVLFDELVKRYFGEVSTSIRAASMLYLANKIFVTTVPEKEAFEFLKQKFIDANIEFYSKQYDELDSATNDKKALIPAEYDSKSLEFLACRFNTPIWLIKMWKKQFGPQLTYPILLANSKGKVETYRVNTYNIRTEDFLRENKNFKESEITDMVTYIGDKALKKSAIKSNPNIFSYSLGYKKLFDLLDCDPIRGIAFYSGSINNAFLELVAQYSNTTRFEVVANHGEPYFFAKKVAEKVGLENVAIYDASASSIVTCISNPVHTFIVLPENSYFANIRAVPDYLLHFKSETFDELLEKQATALEEASNFVEDGGTLAYAVNTLNHKEGKAQIISFLNKHSEFELVEDRQIFPFDKLDCTLYYAVMKKKGSAND